MKEINQFHLNNNKNNLIIDSELIQNIINKNIIKFINNNNNINHLY